MTSRKVASGLALLTALLCGPLAIYLADSAATDSPGRLVALTAAGFVPLLMMIAKHRRPEMSEEHSS
jgi:hypothetical protein